MHAGQLILWTMTLGFGQPDGPPEVAPPPAAVGRRVSVVAAPGGYRITMARGPAELLRDALDGADEKQIAKALRDEAKRRKDDPDKPDADNTATLELVAFLVSTQLPAFKKSLRDNMGPHGVVISVGGLQAPKVQFRRPRPRLERAAEAIRNAMPLLPEEVREAVEAMRAVARTTPLVWKVEPR
jgi:hypothetical protein